jgi:hypothetical protein
VNAGSAPSTPEPPIQVTGFAPDRRDPLGSWYDPELEGPRNGSATAVDPAQPLPPLAHPYQSGHEEPGPDYPWFCVGQRAGRSARNASRHVVRTMSSESEPPTGSPARRPPLDPCDRAPVKTSWIRVGQGGRSPARTSDGGERDARTHSEGPHGLEEPGGPSARGGIKARPKPAHSIETRRVGRPAIDRRSVHSTELQGPLHETADGDRPRTFVGGRDVEVDHEVSACRTGVSRSGGPPACMPWFRAAWPSSFWRHAMPRRGSICVSRPSTSSVGSSCPGLGPGASADGGEPASPDHHRDPCERRPVGERVPVQRRSGPAGAPRLDRCARTAPAGSRRA